jgi:predicted nucleic acid-binding protein
MSGKPLILDTNAVIKLLDDENNSLALDAIFPANVRAISVITQIELLGYPDITEEADDLIRSFLDDIPIISIDDITVENAVEIRRRKPSVRLPDAVIAATAIEFDAILVTNDHGLLKLSFPGLETVNLA